MARALRANTVLRCPPLILPGGNNRSEALCLWPGFCRTDIRLAGGERRMFELRDLFQWDRFITPTIIKTFYGLVIALIALFGISGIFSALPPLAFSRLAGSFLFL